MSDSKSLEQSYPDITLTKKARGVTDLPYTYPEAYQVDGVPTECAFRSDLTVRVIERTGSEQLIANSARVSTAKADTEMKLLSEAELKRMRGLVKRLLRDGHGTPFEYPNYIFYVEVPIFISRQVVKYRLSTINEQSGRYSEFLPVFYLPDTFTRPFYQTGKAMDYQFRQPFEMTEADTVAARELSTHLIRTCTEWYKGYRKALDKGISREVARMGMPVNTYTSMYVKLNLRQVLHFISQRAYIKEAVRPSHGQWEIEQVALGMAQAVKRDFPTVWEAFVESGYAKI